MTLAKIKSTCPWCNYKFDTASCLNDPDHVPKDGNVGFCINCGNMTQYFQGDMKKVDEEELPPHMLENIHEIRKAWRLLKDKEKEEEK